MKVQAYSIKSDETFFLVHADDGYPCCWSSCYTSQWKEDSKASRWVNEEGGVIEGVKMIVGTTVRKIVNALMHSQSAVVKRR